MRRVHISQIWKSDFQGTQKIKSSQGLLEKTPKRQEGSQTGGQQGPLSW